MALAVSYSRGELGLDAPQILVEAAVSGGLPNFQLVGLAETSVKEAKERVRAALHTLGFQFPDGRVLVNLAPADIPKLGGRFDLPIALAILQAANLVQLPHLSDFDILGELSLSGHLRSVPALIPAVIAAQKAQRMVIVPLANLAEASQVPGAHIYGAEHLSQVIGFLQGQAPLTLGSSQQPANQYQGQLCLSQVRGQYEAKRALEVAASGGHHLLMVGPPGSGKTLLAQRLASILPPLQDDAALEVAAIHSLAGQNRPLSDWYMPPFVEVHHTATPVALVGGGTGGRARPGAISLANGGVLFLDELPEFDRKALEVMRQPLESGQVHIARAAYHQTYPASFQLIAAMNPTPSGYFPQDRQNRCKDTPDQIARYQSKISGPLLDRIDMHLLVDEVPFAALQGGREGEPSSIIRQRVMEVRQLQWQRQNCLNAQLGADALHEWVVMDDKGRRLLEQAMNQFQLSARAYHRILRLARTLADMAGQTSAQITADFLLQALAYRAQGGLEKH